MAKIHQHKFTIKKTIFDFIDKNGESNKMVYEVCKCGVERTIQYLNGEARVVVVFMEDGF